MAQPVLTWTTLRSVASQTGEATAIPGATSMVNLTGVTRNGNIPRLVEFIVDPSTPPAVTGSPTSLVIKIYRANYQGDTARGLLYTWTIAKADVDNNEIVPIILEGYAPQYAVKISFVGGTAPTFTGTVLARALE